jgi:hypothetical protein
MTDGTRSCVRKTAIAVAKTSPLEMALLKSTKYAVMYFLISGAQPDHTVAELAAA